MNVAEEVQMAPTGIVEGHKTSDLLDNLLSDSSSAPPTVQQQSADAGGVPLEMQTAPTPQPTTTPPSLVREAQAFTTVEESSDSDNVAMPEDILPQEIQQKTTESDKVDTEGYKEYAPQQVNRPQQQQQLTDAEDEVMPDEVRKSPKRAQDAWTAAKREAKQYKKELDELRQKAQTPQNTEDIDSLKKQLQEAEDRLGQLDITNSTTFKRQYEAPINDIYRESVQSLVKAGHDVEEAQQRVRALINPNTTQEMMAEQLSDLPTLMQGVLYTHANKMRELQSLRSKAIQDWRSTQAAVREEEQRQSESIHKQLLMQNIDSAVDRLRQEGSFLFARSNTDDTWNRAVETRIEATRGIMSGPPDILAKYVADGVAAKTYRQLFIKERINASKLRQDLANVMGGRPVIGRDPSAATAAPAPRDRQAQNPDSWLEANL